jgi:hypothetical protein
MLKYNNREARRRRGGGKFWILTGNPENPIPHKLRPFYWVYSLDDYWWDLNAKKWVHVDDKWTRNHCYSTDCTIIRANFRKFRRLLKQWSKYLPKGTRFVLSGRLRGTEIHGVTT